MSDTQSFWGTEEPTGGFMPMLPKIVPVGLPPVDPGFVPLERSPEHLAEVARAKEAFKAWQASNEGCPIRPLGSQVVIGAKTVTMSPGGIIIPDAFVERPDRGVVLAVGPGERTPKGIRRPPPVRPGDFIIFPQFYAREAKEHRIVGWGSVWLVHGDYAVAMLA